MYYYEETEPTPFDVRAWRMSFDDEGVPPPPDGWNYSGDYDPENWSDDAEPDDSLDGDHETALRSVYGPEDDFYDGEDW